MANLRGNSLVGGKPIVTIDMLNKFVEDIQAAQKDEMMHKYEREIITSNQVIDAYIKDKSKNGVWLCSNVQGFPMYNYGTLVNLSADGSRFQLYAPHIKGSSDKYNSTAGLFFRTGWGNDIKEWKEVADIKYVNEKDNEIKEEINNSLKTEQYLSHEGLSVYAENTIEGRTDDIKIYGKTLNNLCILNNEEYTTNSNIVHSLGKNFKPLTKYMLICDIKDSQGLNVTEKTTYLRVDDKTGIVLGGYVGNISTNFSKIFFEFTTLKNITGYLYLRQRLTVGTQQTIKNIVILEYDENYTNINYFEGIKSFGEKENNNHKIVITSHGKNLFDKNNINILRKTCCSVDNILKEDAYESTMWIKVKPNTKYTLTKRGSYRGRLAACKSKPQLNISTRTEQNDMGFGATKMSISTLSDEHYLLFSGYCELNYDNPLTEQQLLDSIQIVEGDNKLEYEPYIEYKKYISIKEPLRSVGNIQDVLYEDNGQIEINRYVKEYTFTGDENISNDKMTVDETNSTTIGFSILMEKSLTTNANTSIMCNNFITKGVYGLDQEGIYQGWGKVLLRINKSKLTTPDVNGFKAWLKANPTTIVYQLATPTVEVVENCIDLNLATFKEKTYINIENNIKGDMELKIPTNIYSMINSHSKNINKLFNKLEQSFYIRTILINEWQQSHDAFKYTIKHNLGTRLIANVAATKVDGMSTNIDYKIVDENTIEIYVIDKAQLDIIIKTI